MQGKRVQRLQQLGLGTAGRYVAANQAAYWDGKSETSQVVANGTYLYLYKHQKDGDSEVVFVCSFM